METKTMGGIPEKLHTNYPSRFEIEEKVSLVFGDDRIVKDCKIDAVRFTEGKVRYDLAVPLWTPKEGEEQRYTYIENVDSVCVVDAD
jgi:hypothetical protein